MEAKTMSDIFTLLAMVNVKDHVEYKKTGKTTLAYLSWPWAWAETVRRFPDTQYEVLCDANGNHFFDSHYGVEVRTSVTICGVTRQMWLPVMDGTNHAMMDHPYTYMVRGYDGRPVEKRVEAATMMDINKAIMRCLVKNLAMFGMGHALYSGEDLPDMADAAEVAAPAKTSGEVHYTPLTVKRAADAAKEDDPAMCPCGSVKGKPWADIETEMLKKILATPVAKAKTLTDAHRNAIVEELGRRETGKEG